MRIAIDRNDPEPVYKQIQHFLEKQIYSGALPVRTRLPASRDLAASLGVSRLTVTNAYRELAALGLIYSLQGDGTYVGYPTQETSAGQAQEAQERFPQWMQKYMTPDWISPSRNFEKIKKDLTRPGVISFAIGGGDSTLFPLADFRKALQSVFKAEGKEALVYGDIAGYMPLRATAAQILSNQGIPALPGQVMITSGAQQAISLCVRMLTNPGDAVIAESPTHMEFVDLCHVLKLRLLGVPLDENGMQVEQVERLIVENQPRLVYSIPNFHNPTGTCMSAARRRQLVSLCVKHNLPLLEDDYVGDLRYRGSAQPALKALDTNGSVIYISTFSKILFPSLRVGYVTAAEPILERLTDQKYVHDVASSSLVQRALQAYMTVGRYQACLQRARRTFGRRRDCMLAELERCMPPGTRWTQPQGGTFIWLRLPGDLSSDELLPLAAHAGVIYAPGSLFFPEGHEHTYLRLNFSTHPPEIIRQGIQRLGEVIHKAVSGQMRAEDIPSGP